MEQGVATTTLFFNDLKLKGCQACYWRKKNDIAECAVKDDMQQIYPLMQEADGIIVASPIYFAGVTAQTKIWMDRLFPYIGMNLSPKMPPGTKVSFIVTQNQPDAGFFEVPIRTFMHMVGLTGLEVTDRMLGCDLDAGTTPPVEGREDLMEQAYRIGANLFC